MEEELYTSEESISEELDAWDNAWDDETVGVDAPEQDEPEGEPEEVPEEAPEEDRHQVFKLKVLGEEREVSEDEYRSYAQKGADYDGLKSDRDSLRQTNAELGKYKSFLEELAKDSNLSLEELMDQTQAMAVAKRDGIDEERALERVRYERRIKELEGAKEKPAGQEEDFAAFREAHPNVKPDDIPREVWAEVAKGKRLNDAYAAHEMKLLREENKRLRDEAAVRKQEEENRARSTGSKKSPESGRKSRDVWDEAWDKV